jgi:hypothetical protein
MRNFSIILISLFLLSGIGYHANAQLFIKGGAGYGLGTQKILLGTSYSATSTENIYASFGGNLGINLGAGIGLNEYIDFGVDLAYQHGRSVEVYDIFLKKNYTGRLIMLAPSITFKTSIFENISPYGRLGVFTGLPLTKVIVMSEEKLFRGGIPFGANGALGFDFNISDNFKIYTELYRQSMVYKPKKRRESNGDVYRFRDELPNNSTAMEELSHHFFSFGATGLNIGLKIVLQ